METLLIILVVLLGTCSTTLGLFYYSKSKPVLWLITFAITAYVALTGIISIFFPYTSWIAHFTFSVIPMLCLFHCRHYPNWLYFLSIPIGAKIIDVLWLSDYLLTQVPSWVFYVTYIGFELLIITLIFYRGTIAKTLGLNVHYRRIPQEYLLMGVFSLSIIINLITLMEDLIRNHHILGDVFVPYQPMFFYDAYLFLRFPLNVAESILFVMLAYFAVRADRSEPIKPVIV
ncbi:hypothetical protein [Shewanella surugensis]|uniref:Lycopene cyclase domain-containing protein n=1 Tax=Shewanella surugensis TaxID=212020 RepID=A0ABT0L868_9GAMM|nr:hypothetical protein [Shewanella surugensis]MCL1123853.1 hypothetical protein [Shewanella surugensis]